MEKTYPLLGRSHPRITPANKPAVVFFLLLVGCVSYGLIYNYWLGLSIEALIKDELVIGMTAEQVETVLTKRDLHFTYDKKESCYRTSVSYRPFLFGLTRISRITVQMSKDRKVISCTVRRLLLI